MAQNIEITIQHILQVHAIINLEPLEPTFFTMRPDCSNEINLYQICTHLPNCVPQEEFAVYVKYFEDFIINLNNYYSLNLTVEQQAFFIVYCLATYTTYLTPEPLILYLENFLNTTTIETGFYTFLYEVIRIKLVSLYLSNISLYKDQITYHVQHIKKNANYVITSIRNLEQIGGKN